MDCSACSSALAWIEHGVCCGFVLYFQTLVSARALLSHRQKLDIVVISMPSVPKTPSPIAHSGNGTPMRKYPVQRDKVFKQASRAGSPQSDLSSSSALDQVVIAYLTDRLSSASPSALDQVVLDYLTQQALHKCAGLIKR